MADLTLTPVEQAKVTQWINEHWKQNKICPICGSLKWNISEHVVQLNPISPRTMALQLGGIVYPVVMVACESCGYCRFFNAVMIGLVQPSKEEGK